MFRTFRHVCNRALMLGMLLTLLASPALLSRSTVMAQEPDEAGSITFNPSADTFVTTNSPSANYGLKNDLLVDIDGRHEAYLRFDVSGTSGSVQRAILRLWVTDATDSPPELWFTSNNAWTETGVTWNTRPAMDAIVAMADEAEEESWLEYDVTNAVRSDGTYSFGMIPINTDGLDVNSREAKENLPELVIDIAPAELSEMPLENGDGVPVLLAAGDISTCDWEEDEYTARILDTQPGTIAGLGDNVQRDGLEEEFTDCYGPTWGRHKDRIKPAVGNHEYHSEGAEPYYAYFGDDAGDPGDGYYSYELGTWKIIVLNSNIDMEPGSDQETWLRKELEASSATCTLAYWHHPRFSSGTFHGNDDNVAPLWDALYEHGAEIVLNGHEHIYERFAPQTPDAKADPEHGIMQITASTGGARLRQIGSPKPNSVVRSNTSHGVLRLELHDGHYSWQFLAVEGDVFSDSGSGECHDAPDGEASVRTDTPQAWMADNPSRRVTSGRFAS